MIRAGGIDLGGTKIEARLFDADWQMIDRRRVPTARDYDQLVADVAGQVRWLRDQGGPALPVGIGAAGLHNQKTGRVLTANLVADGHPFPADIARAAEGQVSYINDCSAHTLSEYIFGAAKGHDPVVGIILGTGVGGGVVAGGRLIEGPAGASGEFGHLPAPALLVQKFGLPIVRCGCGREGCAETLIAGPGVERIAQALTGQRRGLPDIAAGRHDDPEATAVWEVWIALLADLIVTVSLTVDPELVILGGGPSQIDGLVEALEPAIAARHLPGLPAPALKIAAGGEASGARGAAFVAWQEAGAP